MICHFVYSLLLLLLAASFALPISGDGDADALLKFKSSLVNASVLEAEGWDSGVPPCTGDRGSHSTWKGVMCDNGVVYALRLENMSLTGTLDLQPLVSMPSLESVSFMYNSFEGPMPRGVDEIVTLVYLYLAHNKLSGEIDGDLFDSMNDLVKVHLEGNMFSGEIPESLGRLPKLTELNLEDNMFITATRGCVDRLCFLQNTPPLLPVFLFAITILAVVVLVVFLCSIFIFGRRKHKASEVHGCGCDGISKKVIARRLSGPVTDTLGLGTVYGPSSERQQHSEKSSMDSKVYRKLANEVVQRDSVARSSILELPREEVDKRVDQKKLHFVRNDQEKFTLQESGLANRTPGQVVLDWPIRLKIAKGVTRALDYLYKIFPDLNLPPCLRGRELAAWVESVARTEWTPDVFDTEMQAGREQEGQMLKLLKIGLRCCDWDVERRMELHEAVDRIEEVDHGDVGESFQESFRSSYVTADYEYRFQEPRLGSSRSCPSKSLIDVC
ncbi:hypothetical protein Bca52824_089374 [Brassica carinata]|uniref:Leucine-rich repeat-containing N-terminal plant-type domain-containing protein n=1 Tax=Brassica carinata TaxID=52824 RepID=A0A8X7PD67_BRACI|nr:hypothetical protein Bca52824_089374 [Brassica carinata]